MGKWFRNSKLVSMLIGALGAALTAGYEYWAAQTLKKHFTKGGTKRKRKRKKSKKKQ